jgi:hypothetical protein
MPAITPDGKLILEDIDRLSTAPNGNGAIFTGARNAQHRSIDQPPHKMQRSARPAASQT